MADQIIPTRLWRIYKVTCLVSLKSYIGLTVDSLSQRWANHVCQAIRSPSKMVLHKAIRKYGRVAFVIAELSQHASLEDAGSAEQQAIITHGTMQPRGYNLAEGGAGTPGVRRPHSAETKAKIAAGNKGRIFSAESLAKMSATRTGSTLSAAAREKLRKFYTENPRPPEFYKRMANSKKRPMPIRTLRLLREALAALNAGTCRNYRAEHGKWSTRICIGATKKHLGMFLTKADALAAYRVALMARLPIVIAQAKERYGPKHKFWTEITQHDQ